MFASTLFRRQLQGLQLFEATIPQIPGATTSDVDSSSDVSDSSTSDSSSTEELYFKVAADVSIEEVDMVEQDLAQFRALMRARPCLPLKSDRQSLTSEDLATGIKLPLYSCPWHRR